VAKRPNPVRGALQSAASAVDDPLQRTGIGAGGRKHQPATWRQQTPELARGELDIRNVFEHLDGNDQVEGAIGFGHSLVLHQHPVGIRVKSASVLERDMRDVAAHELRRRKPLADEVDVAALATAIASTRRGGSRSRSSVSRTVTTRQAAKRSEKPCMYPRS
jgi:hypothetical protein